MALVDSVGWGTLVERAGAALPGRPVVLLGWSMGAGLVLDLVQTPQVRGAVLLHGGGPYDGAWPAVPVEVHHAVDDPWMDTGEPSVLLDQAAQAGVSGSLHVYPGAAHLFTDTDHADHDAVSSELLWARVLAFLAQIEQRD
jgi:dienelactone hydrolase